MSERLVKDGWCKQCSRSDIGVSWHPGSRSWYCTDCWPAIKEQRPAEAKRIANLPSSAELSLLRDRMYGFRIEDDPVHIASFMAICPEHGVLGVDLTLPDARAGLSAHVVGVH